MNKLPVVFLSCNANRLLPSQMISGLARILRDKPFDSVVLVSSVKDIGQPDIQCLSGGGGNAFLLQGLMQARSFDPGIFTPQSSERACFLNALLPEAPDKLTELRLNTGMSASQYRAIGQCLEVLRMRGVLMICLDDIALNDDVEMSFDERQLRELINSWVEDHRWSAALANSKLLATGPKGDDRSLDQPTICVLNTAFSLGGSRAPERVFGSFLNDASQTLTGYGWL